MADLFITGEVKAPLQRIVSLAPSVTEMLFYLGFGPSVAGVTGHCDYPPAARELPNIGSFLKPDAGRILGLAPDAVIGLSDMHRHLPEIIRGSDITIVLLSYHSVGGILDVMEALCSLGADAAGGMRLVAGLRDRVESLKISSSREKPVRTLFLMNEFTMVLPARNSYFYDALQIAGAVQVTGSYAEYERVTPEEVAHFNPEVVLSCGHHRNQPPRRMCPDCGLTEPPCQRIVDDLAAKPNWRETDAARNGNISALPCHALCRAGPRLIDGIEHVASLLKHRKTV